MIIIINVLLHIATLLSRLEITLGHEMHMPYGENFHQDHPHSEPQQIIQQSQEIPQEMNQDIIQHRQEVPREIQEHVEMIESQQKFVQQNSNDILHKAFGDDNQIIPEIPVLNSDLPQHSTSILKLIYGYECFHS